MDMQRAIDLIDNQCTAVGIIIVGSWARRTADAASDLDLIVIRKAGPMVDECKEIGNLKIDVCYGTFGQLKRRLTRIDRSNNNFLLNALRTGVIHTDKDGSAVALKTEAEMIWIDGPNAMTAGERVETDRALHRLLRSVEKLSMRAQNSREAQLLFEIRCHQVVVRAIYVYHRARRLWTSGLPQMLEHPSPLAPEVRRLWERYVMSNRFAERLAIASALLDVALQEQQSELFPPV